MEKGLGLLRDVLAAVIGLAILFGVNITQEQVAGMLLVFVTAGAFGTWAYNAYKAR